MYLRGLLHETSDKTFRTRSRKMKKKININPPYTLSSHRFLDRYTSGTQVYVCVYVSVVSIRCWILPE